MRPVAKVLSVAVGLAAVLATAGSALAHDRDDDGWKHWKHRHHHGPRFVPPGHVYYVERPVVVVPARPVYTDRNYYGGYGGYGGAGYGGGGYGGGYYGPPPPPSLNINIPLQ